MNRKGTRGCKGRFVRLVTGCIRRGRVRHPSSFIVGSIIGGSAGVSVVRDVSEGLPLRSVTSDGGVSVRRLLSRVRTVIFSKVGLGLSCCVRRALSSSVISRVCSCFQRRTQSSSLRSTVRSLTSSCSRVRIQLIQLGFLYRITG